MKQREVANLDSMNEKHMRFVFYGAIDFSLIWRYFGWASQTLAAVALWTAAVFLPRRHTRWWVAFLPALFMTVVTSTYILVEEVGFRVDSTLRIILGLLSGLAAAGWFLVMLAKMPPEEDQPSVSARPSESERRGDSLAC